MFHTLNGSTLETVNQTKTPVGYQVPTSKARRFTGPRARSTRGCLCCRKRKKKCDEVHPVCARCKSTSMACIWPSYAQGRSVKQTLPVDEPSVVNLHSPEGNAQDASLHNSHIEPDVEPNLHVEPVRHVEPVLHVEPVGHNSQGIEPERHVVQDVEACFDLDLVVHELNEFKNDLASFQAELEEQKTREETAGCLSADREPPVHPLAGIAVADFRHASKLDSQGLVYLEYYREEYCAFVSIGTESSNYFASTFMALAKNNASIAYALAAWGGYYLELRKDKSDFTGPWRYMQEAAKSMCQQMGDNLQPKSKDDTLYLFAFYLIFIGVEVCTGDIRNWRSFMCQCGQLLQSSGGLSAVSDMFSRNNDIQWMISDFEFHDIVSSKALASGPMFPLHEYDAALDRGPSYGIDPLQGIVGPLYRLMCHMGSAKAELNHEWRHIDSLLRAASPSANSLRSAHYEKVQARVHDFASRIDSCQPHRHHMTLLAHLPTEKGLHLQLFELYRYVCKIQMATALEKLAPKTVQVQHLLLKSLALIDILSKTRFKASLSLSLMVCGMACATAHDRTQMIHRFRRHRKSYELGNLQRIEETLTEVWRLNPTGDVCIDWAEYVGEKGWHLYLG